MAIQHGDAWLDNYVERTDAARQTASISPQFERVVVGAVITRTCYYELGGQRVAMRVYTTWPGTVYWLQGDHLGSASLTTDGAMNQVAELRYYPFGETRWEWGSTPTDRRFTGQRLEAGLGTLYDYGARFYSPVLGRFLSADSRVPDPVNPQALNRYSYVYNRPLNLTDSSGHDPLDANWENDWRKANCPATMDCVIFDSDRQARLYSVAYAGPVSGKRDWSQDDWKYYWLHRDELFRSTQQRESVNDFVAAIGRLSTYYKEDEKDQFVSGIALLYAGWPYDPSGGNIILNTFQFKPINLCHGFSSCSRPYYVNHDMEGFSPALYAEGTENTHHYAGHLLLAFHTSFRGNLFATSVREIIQAFGGQNDTLQDFGMGVVAGADAAWLQAGGTPSGFARHMYHSLSVDQR
jgi:RHS repeat-associated protein